MYHLILATLFLCSVGDVTAAPKFSPKTAAGEHFANLVKNTKWKFGRDEEDDNKYPSETDLPTPSIIVESGYPMETHYVTTPDGYVLALHRIPRGKDSDGNDGTVQTPVYMQHGLLSSSSDWVLTGPEKGLAFILADQGYDVWMGNVRGNTYSRGHLNPNIKDEDYWNFSFDEHGRYDAPAMATYILQTTGQEKMFYVGHSMGTMMFWIASNYHGEDWTGKFIGMFGLGPVAQLQNMVSPLRYMAPFADNLAWILEMFGLNEFLPSGGFFDFLASFACEPSDLLQPICKNIVFLICGYNEDQLDPDLVPYIVGHTPAGTSTKNILHFTQGVNRGGFRKYDFGKKENMEIYGADIPPSYDLSKVDVPVFLFYGENDWLAVPRDIEWLKPQLPKLVASFQADIPSFNHLDFLWAIDVVTLTYNDLLKYMNLLNPNQQSS